MSSCEYPTERKAKTSIFAYYSQGIFLMEDALRVVFRNSDKITESEGSDEDRFNWDL